MSVSNSFNLSLRAEVVQFGSAASSLEGDPSFVSPISADSASVRRNSV
jgi:hypothetical protein